MINSLLETAKKIFGKRLYNEVRAKFLFRDLDSLYPLYPDTPFAIDWGTYSLSDKAKKPRAKAAYIVSPSQRSGTNFLNNTLNRHPDLEFPWGPDLPGEQGLFTHTEHIKEYAYKTVSIWNKWVDGGQPALEQHTKALMASMGDGILEYFSGFAQPGATLLFKTPDTGHLDNFFHVFPRVKVIILVRDGRDTVESFIKSWGGRFTFRKICIRWSQRVDIIWDFIEKAQQSGFSDKVYLLRYDFLVDNTYEEIKNILKFLNVDEKKYPWHELDDIPVVGSSSLKDGGSEVHWRPVKKNKEIKLKQKWLHWNKRKKRVFKSIAGDNLVKLGFAENKDW